MSLFIGEDLYKVLSLSRSSYSDARASRNYRRIMLHFHEDKGDHPGSAVVSRVANLAKRILSDKLSKLVYDQTGLAVNDVSPGNIGTMKLCPDDLSEAISYVDSFMAEEINKDQDSDFSNLSMDCEEFNNGDASGTSGEGNSDARTSSGSSANSSFRQRIVQVHQHTFRRGTLKFKVTWSSGGVTMWERADIVVAEKNGLRRYLMKLREEKPKSLAWILRLYPFLGAVLE